MHGDVQTPRLTAFAIARPRQVLLLMLVATLAAGALFVRLNIDTDPENMLPSNDPVRVRNEVLAEVFGQEPTIVMGVVAPDDITTPERLAALVELQDDIVAIDGVNADATFGPGTVSPEPPGSATEAAALVAAVEADAVFSGNVISSDRSGAAFFVAIDDKDVAAQVADDLEALVAADPVLADLEHPIAGLPLAEDAFGQQMFVQMGIYAPAAGLLVFLLLLVFFRRLVLVLPAMAIAMVTVITTMGLLIGSGNTLHIMSSMIPIFLMPIAILDSVHVLSEFFDRLSAGEERESALRSVMAELKRPLLFTSITTAVGFGALALVPIPPVRVFGIFVAVGVAIAWLLTMVGLPALLMRVKPERLDMKRADEPTERARLARVVHGGRIPIVAACAVIGVLAIPAITTIEINDNPVRWFRSDHEVRVASEELNELLPGTFGANVIITADTPGALDDPSTTAAVADFATALETHPEVGAVQTYLDSELPVLRNGDQANIRLQLRSGDNTVMSSVIDTADAHLAAAPFDGVSLEWAGESYLNLRWQEKMVSGMMTGFISTIVVVFVLLIILFRSPRWALLAILPVLWTVLVVYGALGLIGRDFDMPVAVLSTLVIGIGVDFAIHFTERYRGLRAEHGSTSRALEVFFGEPARALSRNAAVIAIGFTPLFLSSLVPYVVVGAFLASILMLSWLSTVLVLPAIVSLGRDSGATAPSRR